MTIHNTTMNERLIKRAEALLSPEDAQMVKAWTLGGVGLGGSAALLVAALRHLKSMRKTTEGDDDIIYVRAKPDPDEREKSAGLGAGLAITGMSLGTLGTYAALQKLMAELDKREAQKELDKAQLAFIDSKGYEKAKAKREKELDNEKSASMQKQAKPADVGEIPLGIATALPLLAMLATGTVTYNMLDKSNPVKKPKVKAPRKIEILNDDEEYPEEKVASAADGAEFLIRMMGMNKKATDTRNAVEAIARGEGKAFFNVVRNCSYNTALNTVKSASTTHIDPMDMHIAVAALASCPETAEPAAIIAASDFANTWPSMFKAASSLPEDVRDALVKFANCYGKAVRLQLNEELENTPTFEEKMAGAAGLAVKLLAGKGLKDSLLDENESIATADELAGKLMQSQESRGMESDEMLSDEEKEDSDDNSDDVSSSKVKFVAGSKEGRALQDALSRLDSLDVILSPGGMKTIK